MKMSQHFVNSAQQGQRLDKALAHMLGLGLRSIRRMCLEGEVLLNGKTAGPAVKLRAGQSIILAAPWEQKLEASTQQSPFLPVLYENTHFLALEKPSLLHSANLSGKTGDSAELRLKKQFPEATLLNRLDFETSGILVAAKNTEACQLWQKQAWLCPKKKYLALACPMANREYYAGQNGTIRLALDTDNRDKTKVLEQETAETARHTHLEVLAPFSLAEAALKTGESMLLNLVLLACTIGQGARHQIRAHAAAWGTPLWGDSLYGQGEQCKSAHKFFLHHAKIQVPGPQGWVAQSLPSWLELLPPATQKAAQDYLYTERL